MLGKFYTYKSIKSNLWIPSFTDKTPELEVTGLIIMLESNLTLMQSLTVRLLGCFESANV